MNTILIIEDEAHIRRMISIALKVEGFKVKEAPNMRKGIAMALQEKPDLIILDLGLPDGDGEEVLSRLRQTSCVPILVLSARHSEEDKVALLLAGANDYVCKPFSIKELIARIRVLLRDITPFIPDAGRIRKFQDLALDLNGGTLTFGMAHVFLTPKELLLMDILTREVGVFVNHSVLIRAIWGNYNKEDTHYIRVLVRQLRKKLSLLSEEHFHIETSAGHGYRFVFIDSE